jgi:hypothetical protein
MQLDRDDLIDGLRELVRRVHAQNLTGVAIRIAGGAALRLAYFDRDTTVDIDAQIVPLDGLQPIIDGIAKGRGWPTDWLNNNAVMFLPSWGRGVEWETVFDDGDVSILVAPIDALLAMKLNASRPRRDTPDIAASAGASSLAFASVMSTSSAAGRRSSRRSSPTRAISGSNRRRTMSTG